MKITAWLAGSAMLLAAGAAQALPVPPMNAAPDPGVTQVRGGCGFGAHRGPYGGCRLNRGPYGRLGPRARLRRAVTGAPGGCPPGLYRTPRGFCR